MQEEPHGPLPEDHATAGAEPERKQEEQQPKTTIGEGYVSALRASLMALTLTIASATGFALFSLSAQEFSWRVLAIAAGMPAFAAVLVWVGLAAFRILDWPRAPITALMVVLMHTGGTLAIAQVISVAAPEIASDPKTSFALSTMLPQLFIPLLAVNFGLLLIIARFLPRRLER